ncbi:MAG: outer membrane lipoprotein carrier protein LolA [Deltaproteobacteria bacterium]|nr:outer membrane lipoprotein carrier protein LolA [Deltaproteobacteria bacterium]
MQLATAAFYAVVEMMRLASPATPLAAPPPAVTPAPAEAKPVAPTTTPTPPAAEPAKPADPKLDAVVDTMQKTYEGTKDFKGTFKQKFTYTMLRRSQESQGTVTFEKPGRMRWDYKAPDEKSFIVDGKALWLVQPKDKVAFVNACFQQDGLTASVAFLFGDGKLREEFNISWFDGQFGEKTDNHLLLVPKKNNTVFARLILVIDPVTYRVKQSVVVDPAGNVNQFMFSDLQFNKGVNKGAFSYKPTAGINASRMPGSCADPVPGIK